MKYWNNGIRRCGLEDGKVGALEEL